MATVTVSYGAPTTMTITVASLAQAAARESTAVDNSGNKFLDAAVYCAFKLPAGTPGSDKAINVYAYGSADGTNYTDNATGADAALTLRSPTNLRLVAVIATPDAGALTYKYVIGSIAQAFGGALPQKWGICVENRTNLAFDATGGSHSVTYTGIAATVA